MPIVGMVLAALAAWPACDLEPDQGFTDQPDIKIGPPGCPTNWLPVQSDALTLGTASVGEGALILRPDTGEVEVRALLGAQPVAGRKFVLRLEFSKLALGDDGKVEVSLLSPVGPLASLTVQNQGAVLIVEAFPQGKLVEFPLSRAPKLLVVELESRQDLSVAIRAFFGDAGDGKVISLGVDRFDGGLVTPAIVVAGRDAEVRLDRYSKVDPTGGVADDFACNTLGTAFDLDRWPAARVPKAGGTCGQDFECGAGERCTDGLCRATCLASGECPGAVCIVEGEGGTCRLPGEAACETAPDGLVCGPDNTARLGCEWAEDCPGPDDLCVASACVANDESVVMDSGKWGTCPAGETRCKTDDIEICDIGGPGWNRVSSCKTGQCVADGDGARCDDCTRICQGDDVYEKCGEASAYTLASDCRDGFDVCSTGDNNREAPHCRPVIGPKAVAPLVTVQGFGIDATEVTRSQYLAFMQTNPNPAQQPAECAWNKSFTPRDWPWFDAPDRAAQSDFCDAQAYCAWTGRHLCGAVAGGPVQAAALGDASVDAMYAACTSGGQLEFPYGHAFEAGRCSNDTKRDVGSSPGCTTSVAGWTGVFDLLGGVGEWVDACLPQSGPTPDADTCHTRGTSPAEPCGAKRAMRRDSNAGFRCCSGP